MKMILNPSCSEIVWRLSVPKPTKEEIIDALENKKGRCYGTTYMAGDFPNNFLGIMINCLKGRQKECDLEDIKLKMIENENGEDWDFIKEGYRLAKLCLNEKIDRKKAQNLLREFFDREDYEDE